MRYTEFTPFDLVLLAQGLGVSLGLFLGTSIIGLLIGTIWAVIRFYRVPVLSTDEILAMRDMQWLADELAAAA